MTPSVLLERLAHGLVNTATASLRTAHLIHDSLTIQTHSVHSRHVEAGAEPLLPPVHATRVDQDGRESTGGVLLDSGAGVVGRERSLDATEGALHDVEVGTSWSEAGGVSVGVLADCSELIGGGSNVGDLKGE